MARSASGSRGEFSTVAKRPNKSVTRLRSSGVIGSSPGLVVPHHVGRSGDRGMAGTAIISGISGRSGPCACFGVVSWVPRIVARMSAPPSGARHPGLPVPHVAILREERDLAHPPKPARGVKPPFGRRRLPGYEVYALDLARMGRFLAGATPVLRSPSCL